MYFFFFVFFQTMHVFETIRRLYIRVRLRDSRLYITCCLGFQRRAPTRFVFRFRYFLSSPRRSAVRWRVIDIIVTEFRERRSRVSVNNSNRVSRRNRTHKSQARGRRLGHRRRRRHRVIVTAINSGRTAVPGTRARTLWLRVIACVSY